jgi:NAD(P) transhydrogenase
MGVKVTLLHDKGSLLPFLDDDIIKGLEDVLEEASVKVMMNESLESVTRDQDHIIVKLKSHNALKADMFLFASGRSGNVADLKLENAGLAATNRGYIEVNKTYQTKVENIYASGDVVGFPSLASTSMEQGRVAVSHMFQIHDLSSLPEAFPYGIYTIPEVSFVGKKESEMTGDYLIGKAFYSTMPRGKILGLKEGFLKLIVDKKTLTVEGVHIIGHNATELIHFGCIMVQDKKTLWNIVGQVFNFPTLHDLYKYAAYDALSQTEQNPKVKNS